MHRRGLFLSIAVIVASLLLGSARAHASDPVAEAKSLFQQGREAFENKDFRRALPLFQKSQELHPTAGTLLNLALTEAQLGLVASAQKHLRETIAQLPQDDNRLPVAKESLAAVEPRVPHLQILMCSPPPGARVTRDGELIAGERLGAALPLEPGPHAIVVTAPGRPDRRYEVNVEEGKRHAISERRPGLSRWA